MSVSLVFSVSTSVPSLPPVSLIVPSSTVWSQSFVVSSSLVNGSATNLVGDVVVIVVVVVDMVVVVIDMVVVVVDMVVLVVVDIVGVEDDICPR